MSEERYTLEQDDDGHWYVVAVRSRAEFREWAEKSDDPDGYPDGVIRIGGAPNLVSFRNPVID